MLRQCRLQWWSGAMQARSRGMARILSNNTFITPSLQMPYQAGKPRKQPRREITLCKMHELCAHPCKEAAKRLTHKACFFERPEGFTRRFEKAAGKKDTVVAQQDGQENKFTFTAPRRALKKAERESPLAGPPRTAGVKPKRR